MHYGEMTSEALEHAALSGRLTVFELEDIILNEHPSLKITDSTWKAAYKKEISSRIDQAVGCIDYASKHSVYLGYYKNTILYLKDAEQRIREAQKRGYEVNLAEFEEGIRKVLEGTKNDFEGSRALLSFFENSEFDTKEQKTELENRLPELGRKYIGILLKDSRRLAKHLRRSFKTRKGYFYGLENNLEILKDLRDYGVKDEFINEIRNKAYKNGVEFLLKIAKEEAGSNRKKSERALNIAISNAERLDRDISPEADAIRQLY